MQVASENRKSGLLACHVHKTWKCIDTHKLVDFPSRGLWHRNLFIIFPEERTKQNIPKRRVYLKGVCIFFKKSIFVQRLGLHVILHQSQTHRYFCTIHHTYKFTFSSMDHVQDLKLCSVGVNCEYPLPDQTLIFKMQRK